MDAINLMIIIGAMALTSYLPRVIPLALIRRKIKNRFIQSFLVYMPYGVLAAMVFPAVLFSTASLASAALGAAAALLLSFKGMGLLPVALISTAVVFIAERLLSLI